MQARYRIRPDEANWRLINAETASIDRLWRDPSKESIVNWKSIDIRNRGRLPWIPIQRRDMKLVNIEIRFYEIIYIAMHAEVKAGS